MLQRLGETKREHLGIFAFLLGVCLVSQLSFSFSQFLEHAGYCREFLLFSA